MGASLLQPAAVGGLVMGVLSALPIISAGNLCCCLWVVSGGVVAAYLAQQSQPLPISAGDGALVGLLAGIVGAVVFLIVYIPVNLLVAPLQRRVLEELADSGGLPPQFREYVASYTGGVLDIVGSFLITLLAGVIFSTLGGVLGAAIFRRKPPAGPLDVPAPS
jgi:hypothetical protein